MMADLGKIIRETRREAAALPTDKLRDEIEVNLDVQDAAIRLYYATARPGARPEELIVATSTVLISVLTTALYVAELATRPVVTARVVHSLN